MINRLVALAFAPAFLAVCLVAGLRAYALGDFVALACVASPLAMGLAYLAPRAVRRVPALASVRVPCLPRAARASTEARSARFPLVARRVSVTRVPVRPSRRELVAVWVVSALAVACLGTALTLWYTL